MFRNVFQQGVSASAILVAAAASTAALAQQPLPTIDIGAARRAPASQPRELDVEGVDAASTVVDKNAIAPLRAATSDAASLLRDVPGAFAFGAGGVSSLPVLDGMADDRLNVQVSGAPLVSACANHMNPPLSYVAPPQVGNIRVYSGVVPVSVGGDSIGGAILVEPPAPVFAASEQNAAEAGGRASNESAHPTFAVAGQKVLLKGEIGSFYRSNGDGYGGHLSATAATEEVSVTYNGSYARSGNYRAGGAFKPAGFAVALSPLPLTRSYEFAPWLPGNEVGSTSYQTQNHDVSFAVRHENHMLQANVGFQHIPYQNYPNQRMDMTENRSIQGNVRYTGQFDWGALDGQFYHQTVRHGMDFGPDKMFFYGALNTILAPGMPMETLGQNTGGKLNASVDLNERQKLRVGAEYQHYRYNEWWPPSPAVLPPGRSQGGMAPLEFVNINNGQRDRFDVFAELESRWSQQWTTLVGVRSDTVWMNAGPVHGYNISMYDAAPLYPATLFNLADKGRTDQNWNATALATYTPDTAQSYMFGYSLKTRSPNLYERYAWSPATMPAEMIGWFGDGNFYVGNRDLKPEVASTISATADWHDPNGRAALRFTPYFTYVFNYIDAQRCPLSVCGNSAALINNLTTRTSFVYLQFVNQDARIFGADVSGHATLAQDTLLGDFTAKGVLSYVNGQNVTRGGNLYQMMPINAKLSLEQKFFGWTNTFETQLVGAKKNIDQIRNEVKTGAYALFNWRGSYEWRNIRFDIGVENIFNAFYRQPLGGAYIGQLATMSGNGAGAPVWGIVVPGMGRTVYVATNVKF